MCENMKKHEFEQHEDCPFFPCHETEDKENFNCKFCYCPLYFLKECPGNYEILDNGIKDCSNCVFPHYGDIKDTLMEHQDKIKWDEQE